MPGLTSHSDHEAAQKPDHCLFELQFVSILKRLPNGCVCNVERLESRPREFNL